MQEVHQY
jgi:hypothetical protein